MKKLIAIITLLAGIAAAEITYPVDVENTRWGVLDLDSGEVISRNQTWPRADGQPIEGLASNIVMLLHVTATQPQYDSRVFTLQSTETVDASANTLTKTWTTVERPVEEVEVAAKNVEMEQLQNVLNVDLAREAIETRLVVTAIIQYAIDGQTLPPKAQTLANNYRNKGIKIWRNRDRLQEILTAIQADQPYDLDAGWEPAE